MAPIEKRLLALLLLDGCVAELGPVASEKGDLADYRSVDVVVEPSAEVVQPRPEST